MRRNEGTAVIPFAHVLLTFGFDTAVSLTGIEMDLFLCPDWGIGAPGITVYFNQEFDLAFSLSLPLARSERPTQESCDSLSTVRIYRSAFTFNNHVLHILIDLHSVQWVHIGEVRFLNPLSGMSMVGRKIKWREIERWQTMKYEGNRRLHMYPIPLFPTAPNSVKSREEMFRDGICNRLFLPSLYPSSF